MKTIQTRPCLRTLAIAGVLVLGGLPSLAAPSVSKAQANSAGPGQTWQGMARGINLYSLARQTEIGLVNWSKLAGAPERFGLYHSSMAVRNNPALGPGWMHTYDTRLDFWTANGMEKAAVIWGDHRVMLFKKSGGVWKNDDGYRHTLTPDGSNFKLVQKTSGNTFVFEPRPGAAGEFIIASFFDVHFNTIDFQYDANGRLDRVVDPMGRALDFTYTGGGQLSQIEFSATSFQRFYNFTFDAQSRLIRIDLPPVTTPMGVQNYHHDFTYDGLSRRIVTHRDPEGHTTTFKYTGDMLKWMQIPGNSSAQRHKYAINALGERKLTDPDGVVSIYTYDAKSRLRTIRDGAGNTTAMTYADPDYKFAPDTVTDPVGNLTRYEYDAAGNRTRITDPAGSVTDYAYDAGGRVTQILEPIVTDAFGNVDPFRRETLFDYDAAGRLIQSSRKTAPAVYDSSAFAYFPAGGVQTSTNPLGQVTQYTYDANGNLTTVASPGGRTVSYDYTDPQDSFGGLLPNSRTNGLGETVNYDRDEWGRLRVEDAPVGVDATYEYDALGRLVRVVHSGGQDVIVHTPQGWPDTVTHVGGHSMDYAYSPAGRRTGIVETGAGANRSVTYTYDALGRLVATTEGANSATYQYDAAGNLVQRTGANGANTFHTYTNDRLSQIEHFDGFNNLCFRFIYDYQENGLLRRVDHAGGAIQRYQYDALNRLVREQRTGGGAYDHLYVYDSAGRIVSQTIGGTAKTYTFDADGLPQTGSAGMVVDTYAWDADGRLTNRVRAGQENRFSYDHRGRLVQTETKNGMNFFVTGQNAYDGLDRRISHHAFDANGQPLWMSAFHYDGAQLFRDNYQDAFGSNEWAHTWANGQHVSSRNLLSPTAFHSMTDLFGSLRGYSTETGNFGTHIGNYDSRGLPTTMVGQPLPHAFGADAGMRTEFEADTIVRRSRHFDPLTTTPVSVPIELVSLSLVSCDPIRVVYTEPLDPRGWNVTVALPRVPGTGAQTPILDTHPVPQPNGHLVFPGATWFGFDALNPPQPPLAPRFGGTFSSTLPVTPRFSFLRTIPDGPPSIQIAGPLDGVHVIEGIAVPLHVGAVDDIGIRRVEFTNR